MTNLREAERFNASWTVGNGGLNCGMVVRANDYAAALVEIERLNTRATELRSECNSLNQKLELLHTTVIPELTARADANERDAKQLRAAMEYLEISTRYEGQWAFAAINHFIKVALIDAALSGAPR